MTTPWYQQACQGTDQNSIDRAISHQAILTKPAGSLGQLEDIAVAFCGWQNTNHPTCDEIQVSVFAGDHGVCNQGVSAFPQEVTAQMVFNFLSGGAAISVLANNLNAELSIVNMGVKTELEDAPKLNNINLMPGTEDFTTSSAMSESILQQALAAGADQVLDQPQKPELFIGGDMGIGNTTSASAIYSLLLDLPPSITVGPGTGVDEDGIKIKQQVLRQAIEMHQAEIYSPLDVLQRVGGLEIAGLVGAYIACAQQGIPILVDGFITSAAALLATKINPDTRNWMLFAHNSAEPAHIHALTAMQAKPILDIGMRLGEGSGAGVAITIIQSALKLHSQMATFTKAGVSEKEA